MASKENELEIKPGQIYEIGQDGRWNFFFDNSKIRDFSLCEQYFHYAHILNLRPKGRRFSMDIGSWWSDVMSDFYEAMMSGNHTKELILQSAAKNWGLLKMDELQAASPSAWKRFNGRDGAIVMANRYYDAQAIIDQRSWKIVATEAGFGLRREVLVAENDKVVVYYIGKPDLVVIDKDRLCPVDHKTIDRVESDTIKKWKPRDQFPGYLIGLRELAKQLNMESLTTDRCIINICARSEPTDNPRDGKPKPRFIRAYPNYSPEELQEWRSRKLQQALRLRYCIENQSWLWNDNACHLYDGCCYRRIDATAPGARPDVIRADFVKVEPWVPYKVED